MEYDYTIFIEMSVSEETSRSYAATTFLSKTLL